MRFYVHVHADVYVSNLRKLPNTAANPRSLCGERRGALFNTGGDNLRHGHVAGSMSRAVRANQPASRARWVRHALRHLGTSRAASPGYVTRCVTWVRHVMRPLGASRAASPGYVTRCVTWVRHALRHLGMSRAASLGERRPWMRHTPSCPVSLSTY